MEQTYSKKSRYLVLLIFCVAGMVIFDRSLVFVSAQMSIHRLIVIALNIFVIGAIPAVFALVPGFTKITDCVLAWFVNLVKTCKRNWKNILKYACLVAAAWVAAWILENCLLHAVLHEAANDSRRVFIFAILTLGIAVYGFRKRAGRKPEQFFAVVALILGCMLIRISPAMLGTMVDDETHYARVLAEANLFDGSRLDVEQKTLDDYALGIMNKFGYDRETRNAYYAQINAMYEQKKVVSPNVRLHGIWSFAYIPMAVGTIVGQGLSLSFVHTFMLAKFFNLLFYILLMYVAIRKVSYGKVLLATIGMIPTCIFMAANYSYDPWVIGFVVLAYAYFFYEIQNPEKKLETKNAICMLVFLVAGCMPKAIYIVLGIPFLFMPKSKFASKKQRFWYYMPVLAAGLALAATFVVPMLIHGIGEGDTRGGEDIDATAQLAYVLTNPGKFASVIASFLKNEFFTVANMQTYLQRYFYFGYGEFYGFAMGVIVVTAFLDKRDAEGMTVGVRISGVAASFLAAVACAAVMYLVYSPVGGTQIGGCQGRYLLPMLFPFLVCVTPDKIDNRMNPHAFAMVPSLLLAATFFYNIYNMCVALY